MRNPLKHLARRGTSKPTLRERANVLKVSAARVLRRHSPGNVTDQPEGESLLDGRSVKGRPDAFTTATASINPSARLDDASDRDSADGNAQPSQETDMGRHETFATAVPIAEGLLSGTALGQSFARRIPHAFGAGNELDGSAGAALADDAELLLLGEHLDRAHAQWRIMERRNREPSERLNAAIQAAQDRPGGMRDGDLKAAWELPGVSAAHRAAEDAFLALAPICDAIWDHPARTTAGLAVKARAALVHTWTNGRFEADASQGDDEDMEPKVARQLIEACCSMAGVDWRGDPIEPAQSRVTAAGVSGGAISAKIEAHRTARAAADEACNSADVVFVRKVGGDTSDEAMAPSQEAWRNASEAQDAAWNALLVSRPANATDLAAMLRYIAESPATEIVSDPKYLLAHLAEAAEAVARPNRGRGEHYTSDPNFTARAEGVPSFMAHLADDGSTAGAGLDVAHGTECAAADDVLSSSDVKLLEIGVRLDEAEQEFLAFKPAFDRAQEGMQAAQDEALKRVAGMRDRDLIAELMKLEEPFRVDLEKGRALSEAHDTFTDEAMRYRPATLEGVAVLARAARFWWRDALDGNREDLDYGDALAVSLIEGVLSSVEMQKGRPASVGAQAFDLSGVPLKRLGILQETFRSLWLHASGELQAPWCWDSKRENHNAAGDLLDAESERLAGLVDRIGQEAERRIPKNDDERDERLEVCLRSELLCEGRIRDRRLIAEIIEAWGA